VERGVTTPSLPLLKRLAEALDARLEVQLVPEEQDIPR